MVVLSLALILLALTAVWAAPTASPDAPDFLLGPDSLVRRQDYDQNYKTGGTVNFQSTSNGYSVTFSGASDFVVGKGWKTGSSRNITFSGSTTQTAGTVLVAVYGWTRNPLVEYYIEEYASNGKGSAQGDILGTVVSDGSTYDIYKHTQVNQPSISGTTNFTQYISLRRENRTDGGTITVQNHFDAWESIGLSLGTSFDYQVLATEGWGSASGNSQYTISTDGSSNSTSSGGSSSSSKASSATTKAASSASQQTTIQQTTSQKTTKTNSVVQTSVNNAKTSNTGFTSSASVSATPKSIASNGGKTTATAVSSTSSFAFSQFSTTTAAVRGSSSCTRRTTTVYV